MTTELTTLVDGTLRNIQRTYTSPPQDTTTLFPAVLLGGDLRDVYQSYTWPAGDVTNSLSSAIATMVSGTIKRVYIDYENWEPDTAEMTNIKLIGGTFS